MDALAGSADPAVRSDFTSDLDELFISMGPLGVYARSGRHEEVIDRLGALIARLRPDGAEVLSFPPVMSRTAVERSGYLKSFPNLLGCVSVLEGTEPEIRQTLQQSDKHSEWTESLAAADLVLSPAACYPVYPIAAGRGLLPRGGLVFDVQCDCFRREPSREPDRLQSFRMRELVRIGTAAEVVAFRACWMQRAEELAVSLGLPSQIAAASDPFFGREGQIRGVSQLQQALKFELLIPTWSLSRPTACMSFNYHRDHFGTVWDLRDERGETAHTACVAFGLDRLALALFCNHGADVRLWPDRVRATLQV